MTAPQEPLKLTLEEGLSLAKKYMVAYLEESSWPDELREKWPEDLDADYRTLFERPVAVRDDAAELRALLREAVEEIQAAVEAEYPLELRQRYRHISRRYLRDMELPDRIRAALAATEGRGEP